MKRYLTYSILLAITAVFTGCQKDFLNTSPTETVSTAPPEQRLNGLYLMMIQSGTGGTTAQSDFGQKMVDMYTDFLSGDMALTNAPYGWFQDIANLKISGLPQNTYNYIPWRYYYRMIYETNKSIAELATPKNDREKYALAQFHALRAHAYYYLMQLFTTKYEPNSSTNSIPLYTQANVTTKAKAKQSDIYALIVSDLQFAIDNLDGFRRDNKGMIDKNVAKGILAYVYATMGENQKVAELAQDIINKSGYPLTTREQTVYNSTTGKGGGFNDVQTSSWMWGFDIIAENGVNLGSWWGFMDMFTYSYASVGETKAIDDKLHQQIRNSDIRKKQFDTFVDDEGESYSLLPVNKFFAPERKFQGQRVVLTDYIFMRVDEFYLLAAEALAKLGQDAQAKTIYKKLLTLRYPEATAATDIAYVDALSNTELQDDIYLNTRIELWGEGKSYLALKRNHKTVNRGSNHYEVKNQSFNYDNPKLSLTIPQNELQNNLDL